MLREWVERFLPWYSPAMERLRDQRTERIARESETARQRADSAIRAYRHADDESRHAGARAREAGEDLIEGIERDR